MAKYFWNHKNFFCLRAVSNKTLLRNGAWHFSKSHENLTPQKFWSYIHSNTAVIFCIKGWKFRKLVQLPPCFLQYEQCLAWKELAFGYDGQEIKECHVLVSMCEIFSNPFHSHLFQEVKRKIDVFSLSEQSASNLSLSNSLRTAHN